MLENSPFDNDDEIKNQIVKTLCYKITEKIHNNKAYVNYLLNSPILHEKLLVTLNDALHIHEIDENYEMCQMLYNFKNILIKQNLN